MRLKSYYAGTVEAAMALACKEPGPDAMIVTSRPASPEACRPGEYEVVFAVTPSPNRVENVSPAPTNETIRSGLPVSSLCTGRQIPEDIEEAMAARLLETAFLTRISGTVAAA